MAVLSDIEFTPDLYPPFPSASSRVDLPLATLKTISLMKILLEDDVAEQQRMFQACQSQGFFYLDLSGCEAGQVILEGADQVAQLAEKSFKLPVEEKLNYAYKAGDLFGYKRVGLTKVDANSTPDTAEFFSISKDFICHSTNKSASCPYPPTILAATPLLKNYMTTAHSIGLRILQSLFTNLGVSNSADKLTSRHAFDRTAGDHIRMIRGPPRVSPDPALPEIQTPAHTDFGSVTLLMNWLGGLQVWSSSDSSSSSNGDSATGEWLWVRPKPNCAIINLGDAAKKFSGGALCSGRHRVVPAPGEQGLWPRYSVVYFVRPNDECVLRALEGSGMPRQLGEEEEAVTAREWIARQAEKLRIGAR